VEITGTLEITGAVSSSYGLEVDLCTHLSDYQSSAMGAYMTGGATGSAEIDLSVSLSAGLPLILKATISASMTIISGSLTALASVGGGTTSSAAYGKGEANVNFNAAAMSGSVSFEIALLEIFDYSWQLYAWDGRELADVNLLNYDFSTRHDYAHAVTFTKGDVPDYGACAPGSSDASQMCQSSVCTFAPTTPYCQQVINMADAQAQKPPSCNKNQMHHICRPVDGFTKGKACSQWSERSWSGSTLQNDCAKGLFCFAGTLDGRFSSSCQAPLPRGTTLAGANCLTNNCGMVQAPCACTGSATCSSTQCASQKCHLVRSGLYNQVPQCQ